MVSVIDLFTVLRFHTELLLSVEGVHYLVHPICEGLSGVGPTWRIFLSIGTHYSCLPMNGRIFLGILQRVRRLVFTLLLLSVAVVNPF